MFDPLDNWETLKTFSEVIKKLLEKLLEALAVIGGLAALWKWLIERKDRATDILLKLETEFRDKEVMQGRQCIEDDERYRLIKDRLKQFVAEFRGEKPDQKPESGLNAWRDPGTPADLRFEGIAVFQIAPEQPSTENGALAPAIVRSPRPAWDSVSKGPAIRLRQAR